MNLDIRKKFIIVKSVIDKFQDTSYTIGEIYLLCDQLASQKGIIITQEDVCNVMFDLYDNFDIDREISEDNIVRYKNIQLNATVSGR